jgi:hypothetical protein
MSVKFQLRGTQLDAWYASAWGAHYTATATGSISLVSSGASGVFGGSYIDGTNSAKALNFMGADNWSTTNALTLMFRIIPTWTGNPSAQQELFLAGDVNNNAFEGLQVVLNTDGTIYLLARNSAFNAYIGDTFGSLTYVSGQPTDIWVVWDGSKTTGAFKLYQAQNGNVPTLVGTHDSAYVVPARSVAAATGMAFCRNNGTSMNAYINEAVIWDSVEDPTSYGARAAFITTTASTFQGYANTDPGIANVLSGTNYIFGGNAKTGSYTPPLPNAADLRNGTVVSSVTGTLKVPSPSSVLLGVQTDATVGAFDAPTAGNVKKGVAYGAGDALTGTYDGSDRWTDPGAANVLAPSQGGPASYLANGVTEYGIFVPGNLPFHSSTRYDVENLLADLRTILAAYINGAISDVESRQVAAGLPATNLAPVDTTNGFFEQSWSDAIMNSSPAIFYGIEEVTATGIGPNTVQQYKIFIEVVMVDGGMDQLGKHRIHRYTRAIREVLQANYDKLPSAAKTKIETVRPVSFKLDLNSSEEIKVGGVSLITALA